MVDVLKVRPLAGFKLWLRFSDGYEGVRDFSDLVQKSGPMVEPLRAPEFFGRVFIEMGALTWPNGFDLDTTNLYMKMRECGDLKHVAAA